MTPTSATIGSSALLLDTHIITWMLSGDRRLSPSLHATLTGPGAVLLVSAVIAFEYADLQKRGRLPGSVPFDVAADVLRLEVVDLPGDIWRIVTTLPEIHRDPVDRLLVAHAIVAGLPVASADQAIQRYPIRIAA